VHLEHADTMSPPVASAVIDSPSLSHENPLDQGRPLQTRNGLVQGTSYDGASLKQVYSSPPIIPHSAVPPHTMSQRLSERSPSPHHRGPSAGAMAEAIAAGKSPGLIRRMSRGAHNKLRRRASTNHSLRMRDQSAGPVLMRRRSDSNGASDYGQDVSDLDLDCTIEDLGEEPEYRPSGTNRNNPLGINVPRSSDASAQFEGGIAAADSPVLQAGTELVKLTKKRRKLIKLWLDSTHARICWHPKTTTKSFFIDDVVAVRKGADSRNARDDIPIPEEDEGRSLTIVYTIEPRSQGRTTKAMHLLMPDNRIMKLWVDALSNVQRDRAACMSALSSSTEKSERGMNILWRQTMSGKGETAVELMTLDDARSMCRQLQINCNEHAVKSHFERSDSYRSGKLDFEQFRHFIKSFKQRKDIQHLFRGIRHGLDSDMSFADFMNFLRDDQGCDIIKDREYWENVFDKYGRAVQHNVTTAPGSGTKKMLSMQGFQNFLTSSYNNPLSHGRGEASLDRPLNEYFISSSHNTYLIGRQVRGTSSVEGYIDALIEGCRCIEIDCWDGDNHRPMVTHGRTMTTKIPFEDCVSVIAKYAFHSSPYPLIVSLEVHCNAEQQDIMVDLMEKYFDGMMVTEPMTPTTPLSLPSPEELRQKILIKVKAATATPKSSYAYEDLDPNQLLADFSNGRSRARSVSSAFARSPSGENSAPSYSPYVSSPGATSPSEVGPTSISTPRGSTTSGPTMTPSSSGDDSDEIPVSAQKMKTNKTSKITPRLGRLGVYTQGISYPKPLGFTDPAAKTYNHIFSFSEDTFNRHAEKGNEPTKTLLGKHNSRYLMRVYPAQKRILSDNFNPISAWRRGVQMVALNWQTYDVHQQVNRAMFAAGSDKLGYVLKPEDLRPARYPPAADAIGGAEQKDKKHLVKFDVEIISAQRLPRPRNQNSPGGMNPYIEFEMYSAEDKAAGVAVGAGGTDASAPDGRSGIDLPLRKRTKVCMGNGFDPEFHEPLTMIVHTKFPSLIFVRWTVWHQSDKHKGSPEHVLLATFTAKLTSLQQGYRHLPLFNPQGEQYQDAKLFVRIRRDALVLLEEDGPGVINEPAAFVRSDSFRPSRPDAPGWTRRLFSRNPSGNNTKDDPPRGGFLSRTSSMECEPFRLP